MSTEIGTPSANRRDDLERTVIEEAIRILSQTFDGDELTTLPWIGLHYRTEP
jgi:hypothetical protein